MTARAYRLKSQFVTGFTDIAPLAIGVAVYGLAFGLLAAQANMTEVQTGLMGALVFAGSSQIIAIERLVAEAGALAALLAGIALNMRILLITASLRDELNGRPLWQVVLGCHLATDENWALLCSKKAQSYEVGYWYLVGGGLCLMVAWVVATMFGVRFANVIPESRFLGLDFAFTAAFIAIARNMWRGREDLIPWCMSGGVALLLIAVTDSDSSAWILAASGLLGALSAGFLRR